MKKKIFTMQQILELVTDENIDRFMKDLERFVRTLPEIKKNFPDFTTSGFTWIDDGKEDDSLVIETPDAKLKINSDGASIVFK